MKRKKKILISVGAVVLCVGIVFSVYLSRHRLSLMNEEECISYLKNSGVFISDDYEIDVVKEELYALEHNPKMPRQATSYIDTSFEQVRVVVNMYYHRPKLPKNTVLSEMADDECKQFLTDVGVEIWDSAYTMSTVKDILAKYENDRNYTYEYTPEFSNLLELLHNQLRVVVFMYYQ